MINVKDAPYNATGDGVTDDSTAIESAFSAALAQGGAEIYFPVGVYNLPTWTVPTLDRPIRLRGEVPAGHASTTPGATVLRGPGTATGYRFARIAQSLSVFGLTFENWGIAFNGDNSGAVEAVTFQDCSFRDSLGFLEWPGGTGEFVGRLAVDRCTFQNLTSAVVLAGMSADAVYFTHNRVENCRRYALRVLGGESTEGRELVVFSGNYVSDLTADGFTGAAAVARVVQVSCQRLVVTDNHVQRVRAGEGGNANFIYQSSVHVYVAGNHLEDVGTPGDATGAIIQEKNEASISGRYIGNLFVQSPAAPGVPAARPPAIQILSGGHTVVHGNEARGLHHSLVFFAQNAGDLVVSNNVVADSDNPFGAIRIYGGKNVVIEGNVIDRVRNTYDEEDELPWQYFARGNSIERYAEPVVVDNVTTYVYHAPENVRISNNVINDVRRISETVDEGSAIFLYASSVTVRNLSIVGNTITDCDTGVDLRVAGTGSFADTELSYNTFGDNRVNVYAPTPPAAFTTRANRGWITEASGTASVVPTTSSVVVPHGLARTPSLGGISVTPASPPDTIGAGRYWVSNVNATTFTINVDVAPGAPVSYAWTAQIL